MFCVQNKNKSIFFFMIGKVLVIILWFLKEGKSEQKKKNRKYVIEIKYLKFF